MKLLSVVVFGFVALAGSEVYSSRHHGKHDSLENIAQGHANERYAQSYGNQGLNQNQFQNDQEVNHKINYNQENSNERSLYDNNKQYNHGLNDESNSESNWNAQSSRNSNRDQQINQAYNQGESQMRSQNQQNSEEYYQQQQQLNTKNQRSQNYGLSSDHPSSGSVFSTESNSQEDYVKEQSESTSDIANDIGYNVAQKMVKFYNIIEKYAARDGTVQTKQAGEPLTLRQWAIPMANHHFLNMNDSKVYGLNQGVIKAMYVNTEKNCVDLEYFFDDMQVRGNIKASTGPKGSFRLKMANTNVNVSTELGNHNRNYAQSRNGKIDISYHNFQELADSQSMNEHIDSKYVQFINRAVESEMVDSAYSGLVKCLRSEIESTFEMPVNTQRNLEIVNKKSQLTVSLLRTREFNDNQSYDRQRKVQYVAFRENKSGNGYRLKVKIVLAKQPTWESDVVVQKASHHQHINVSNVKFQADQIVAYAVMERLQQNGEPRFNVKDAYVKLDGLKYDTGKFNLANSANEKLAREVGHNLHKILENGMSAALQKQLYQQQQICQQNMFDCVRCNQYN